MVIYTCPMHPLVKHSVQDNCPICGMKLVPVESLKNLPWYKSHSFGKVFPWFLATVLIIGTFASMYYDFMITYMGIFFIVFSLFKMPAWKGFVEAFRQYDLLAKALPFYAWIYPAVELVLGLLFIFKTAILPSAWIALTIMAIGGIGVGLKLLKHEKFQCACLGTWLNVPLTYVTLLEDVLMVIMAVRLIWIG